MGIRKNKPAKTAAPAQEQVKSEPKSNKEQVKSEFKDAKCIEAKNGFIVMSSGGINKKPLHSGIASSELNAWKKALHSIL